MGRPFQSSKKHRTLCRSIEHRLLMEQTTKCFCRIGVKLKLSQFYNVKWLFKNQWYEHSLIKEQAMEARRQTGLFNFYFYFSQGMNTWGICSSGGRWNNRKVAGLNPRLPLTACWSILVGDIERQICSWWAAGTLHGHLCHQSTNACVWMGQCVVEWFFHSTTLYTSALFPADWKKH